ncbi:MULTISPECIES: type II toxin-antitoxin system VapC family toxin [Acinetobacter calcoaceticus/baumannii complex]|uniref:type II toxin-antitoxin system VapC family toxin n=1 Tax=Acinetobacter calcoaceticus/baumannii complex TaxID=909768 RepID=UPI002380731D|nr:PIN domain-containing protein [Acinetobacter pittii]MDE4038333.1 PIN domain-containing protein [Acinetobacter pittii]WPP88996.1 PIN domain-containing protein [Acinetobacter pittii]
MSTVYNLRENVIPDKNDRYFLDTNVWFWFTYCATKQFTTNEPHHYQLKFYPEFIEKILDVGAKIVTSPLVYTELANLIERTEYEEYLFKKNLNKESFSRKQFRAISSARNEVLLHIKTAWETICQLAQECLELNLNLKTTQAAHDFMSGTMLDPYDAIFVHILNSHDIKMLISDDGDMVNSGIEQIFTANRKYLQT